MHILHRFRYVLPNTITLAIAFLFMLTYQSWAFSPASELQQPEPEFSPVISYQGTLTNELGQPINESMPMTFRLYDSADGEAALWTEIYTGTHSIQVQNGQFQVWLGSQTAFPDGLWGMPALFLGIQIDNDAEMAPRERMGTTPHAMKAEIAAAVPDRSIRSAQLALQQQVQPIESATPINVTSIVPQGIGVEIPGSELNVVLDKAGRILYTAQAIASYSEPAAIHTIQVVVDGVPLQLHQVSGQTIDTISILRYLDLSAGSHRITLNYLSSISNSQLQLVSDSISANSTGNTTYGFVSYLVIDQE